MEQPRHLSTVCLSCGAPIAGRYCGACGEKVLRAEEKTVSHFLAQAFHTLTHADSKFFRSLGCLLTRPGTITVNYLTGKRKRYMSPLSIFVFANLLYLLLSPIDALNSSYYSQRGQPYGSMVERRFEEKMKLKGWNEIQMGERYDAKSGKLAKLLLILLVLYFSVPLAIVYYSSKRYFVDHLVFSTDVINYLTLVVFLIVPWFLNIVFWAIHRFFGIQMYLNANDDITVVILLVGLVTYIAVATHRVYRAKWWVTIVKSVVLFVGLYYCLVLYRFTLFQATMALL